MSCSRAIQSCSVGPGNQPSKSQSQGCFPNLQPMTFSIVEVWPLVWSRHPECSGTAGLFTPVSVTARLGVDLQLNASRQEQKLTIDEQLEDGR